MGRPCKKLPDDFDMLVRLWEEKKLPPEQLFSECGFSRATFYRRLRERKPSGGDQY